MGLMEIFSNPETIHSLSMGDKLLGGCITMLMGMGITFLVLLILWAFIAIMGRVVGAADRKGKKAAAQAEVAAAPSETPSAVEAAAAESKAAETATDEALVAVIMAAIAAYEGTDNRLVVRKISRVSGNATPWSIAAKEDCIASRKF